MKCSKCSQEIIKPNNSSTGYGVDKDNNKVCYACCAVEDKKYMVEHDKITLYLTIHDNDAKVTNWPGSLVFDNLYYTIGRHNWGLPRYDVWFMDHADQNWHGIQIGDNTQLVHCKKLKG